MVLLTDRPVDAKWLDEDERTWLRDTLAEEARQRAQEHPFTLRNALTGGRVLALSFVYFGTTYAGYALTFFLPTIVDGFQEQFGVEISIIQAGLITAIPYVFGAVVMIWWTRHGDRKEERVWHVAAPLILSGVSIPIALADVTGGEKAGLWVAGFCMLAAAATTIALGAAPRPKPAEVPAKVSAD